MNNIDSIQKDFNEVLEFYPSLELVTKDDDTALVYGPIALNATYNKINLKGKFEIEIIISSTFPNDLPLTKEIGGQIPNKLDYHKVGKDILCLGSPLEIRKQFSRNPTLIGYINNLVVPFLFSFCYRKEHEEMPYGELEHGYKGILENYKEIFNTTSDLVALRLLKILAENGYRGHLPCS